jgi:hypothetical protein
MKNDFCSLTQEEIRKLPERFQGFLLSPFQCNQTDSGYVFVPGATFKEMIDIITEYAAQQKAPDVPTCQACGGRLDETDDAYFCPHCHANSAPNASAAISKL